MKTAAACAIFTLLLVTACMPQLPRQAEVTAKPASPAVAGRSFFYEGMTDGTVGDLAIQVANGLACMVQSDANLPRMQKLVPDDPALAAIVREEFARAGYRNVAIDGTGGVSAASADYRIEGVLTRASMNICYPFTGNFGDGHGQASITVDWRVSSRRQTAPAFTSSQRGYAELSSTTLAPNRILWRKAFAQAVLGLLSDDSFIAFISRSPTDGTR